MFFRQGYGPGFYEIVEATGVAGKATLALFLLVLGYALLVQFAGFCFRRRLAMIPFSLLPFMAGCCGAALHFIGAIPPDGVGASGEQEMRIAFTTACWMIVVGGLETIVLFCFAFLLLLGKHAGPRPVNGE